MPSVDGLRGLAILLVLMIHFCCLTKETPQTSLDWLFYEITYSGWCGVSLFFMLSGFLITGILYDNKFSQNRMRNFYARRTLRIFPLYYGVLILWLLVLPVFNLGETGEWSSGKKAWVWLYAVNWGIIWSEHRFGIMVHFWSLAVEEHFYFVWPFVICFFSRTMAMRICIACFIAATLSRAVLFISGVSAVTIWAIDTSHLDSLCVGGWIALTARGPSGSGHLVRPARKLAAISLITLACVVAWRGKMSHVDGMFQIFGFPPLMLFFGSGLVLVVHAPMTSLPGLIFNAGIMKSLGKYSYGLYVWHHLLSARYDSWFPTKSYVARFGGFIPAVTLHAFLSGVATLIIAVLSFHIYEIHFINLKRFFTCGGTNGGDPRRKPGLPSIQELCVELKMRDR